MVGNLKHHFLLKLPRLPSHKHVFTQLSTVALNIIYCNCLFTCLIWFHPLNCEAGTASYLLPHPKAVPGTQHTHNICCTFLLKIFILFPGKPLHSSFKTPSLLWSFLVLIPSRISSFGSHCTYHNKFSLFCVSAFSIRLCHI